MEEVLPEGWALTTTDAIGAWQTGGIPSRKQKSYFGGGIPWVKSGDLKDGKIEYTEETISQEGLENSNAKIMPKGTLVIALYGATIGKLAILGMDAATNQACANCVVNKSAACPEFLFYYLFSQRQQLIEAGQGGAQPNLSNGLVRSWPLILPPLAEQKRIVAKVEEVFAHVQTARQQLAKAARLLGFELLPKATGAITQSVLAKAFRGELVQTEAELARAEGRNYEPASVLLNRVRAERSASTSPKPSRRRKT